MNISLEEAISGVYAATVRIGGKEYIAAAFANTERCLLEAHLLNFNENLYGKDIAITLCKKIRETEKFETEETLKAAIAKDINSVKEYFSA